VHVRWGTGRRQTDSGSACRKLAWFWCVVGEFPFTPDRVLCHLEQHVEFGHSFDLIHFGGLPASNRRAGGHGQHCDTSKALKPAIPVASLSRVCLMGYIEGAPRIVL
jgi:hypothetical protein